MSAFAFVFPGQGSQAVGMLDAWADHRAVRDTLAEASAALGEDIAGLIRSGPKEQLDLTRPFREQAQQLFASVGLADRDWERLAVLVHLPDSGAASAIILAVLHAKMGRFPAVLRMRAVPDRMPPRLEVAEIIDVQRLRDEARVRR